MAPRPRPAPGRVLPGLVAAAVLLAGLGSGTTPRAGATLEAPGPAAGSVSTGTGPDDAGAERTPYGRRLRAARRPSLSLEQLVGRSDPPNVVVLMLDDLRADDLQFMPHTRRLLAGEGVTFENALAPHPLCCPARASFLTGRYSHNHGVWSHLWPYGFRVLDDRQTLPVWLRERGWSTTFLGKYLNRYGRQSLLDGSPSARYVPPGWTDWRGSVDSLASLGLPEDDPRWGGTYRYWDNTLNHDGRLEPHPGSYQTHLMSRLTQEVVRTQARSTRPFFVWTNFVAPHVGGPREPDDPRPLHRSDGRRQPFPTPARPEHARGRLDHVVLASPGRPGNHGIAEKPYFLRSRVALTGAEHAAQVEVYRQRAESIAVVDDEVAHIVEALERSGELDNTYLMLTSDNGYFLGEHRMRRGKILPYDPSLRVPLVVRGPGVPRGQVRRDPFLMVDFAPTVLAIAGAEPPVPVDGVSMLEVLREGDRGWLRPVLTETGPRKIHERERLQGGFLDEPHGPSEDRFTQGVRTARYLYAEHASGERELYDLRRDPLQWHNLAGSPRHRGVMRALATELDRLRTCAGDGCAQPLPARFVVADPPSPVLFDATRGYPPALTP